jgi:hypothetical protein
MSWVWHGEPVYSISQAWDVSSLFLASGNAVVVALNSGYKGVAYNTKK